MRVALCLQGLSDNFNNKGDLVDSLSCVDSIHEHIITRNNADVFIHTWSTSAESIEALRSKYDPKLSIFEKQIMFDSEVTKYHCTKSRWYSQMKSIELKKQYEQENNFVYDIVMISRFDCFYRTHIDFSSLEADQFYASNWLKPHSDTGFLDYWFISNSLNMNKFGDLYHKIDEYLFSGTELSNHTLSKHHIKSLGLEDNTSYVMFSPKDFDLIRML
jgi:hypothetical protein